MDINRNQWFLLGMVLFMLGVQFRLIDSVVLNPQATKILAERSGHPVAAVNGAVSQVLSEDLPVPSYTWSPPEWLGWSLISLGSVLILHSLAMKPPGS